MFLKTAERYVINMGNTYHFFLTVMEPDGDDITLQAVISYPDKPTEIRNLVVFEASG